MLYFIDFDRVIFNDRQFKSEFKNQLIELGIPNYFVENYYSNKNFNQKSNLSRSYQLIQSLTPLSERFNIGQTLIKEKIDTFLSSLNQFVYPDFFEFGQNINPQSAYILTSGCPIWQELKINSTKVDKYFKEIIFADELPKSVAIKNKNFPVIQEAWFIDDRLMHIIDVKKTYPQISAMHLRRDPDNSDTCHQSNYTVTNLIEAQKIINQF